MNWLTKGKEKRGDHNYVNNKGHYRMNKRDLSSLITKTQRERKQKYMANIYKLMHIKIRKKYS